MPLRDAAPDDIGVPEGGTHGDAGQLRGVQGMPLQLPVGHGRHYVKRRVRVHEHADGTMSVFHGPRRLARYDAAGAPLAAPLPLAAG